MAPTDAPPDYPDRGRTVRAMTRLFHTGCLSIEVVPEQGDHAPLRRFGVRVVTPCGCPVVRTGGADVGALLEDAVAGVEEHLRGHSPESLDA